MYKFDDPSFYINNKLLTDQFIDEHKDEIDWKWLTKHYKLIEEQIEKYTDFVDWKLVWLKQNVSEEFIEKHEDKLENWDWICVKRKLSIPFVHRHMNKWHWTVISQESIIDYDFALEFRDKLDWRTFTIHRWNEWSESFIREFKDYIEWEYAFYDKRKMSNNLRREYVYSFKKKKDYLNIAYSLNDQDFREWATILNKKYPKLFGKAITWNTIISEKTILDNIDYFSEYIKRGNVSKKIRKVFEKINEKKQ